MGLDFEGDTVATKKRTATVKAKPAPAPEVPKGTQPNAITIRGSVEWQDWLKRFSGKMRVKPTALIDLALAKLAEQERFVEPPSRM